MHFAPEMERPFYDTSEDRTNLVPSLLQDAPWVQISDAGAGVESTGHKLRYPNAVGPNAIYDTHQSYHAVGWDVTSSEYPGIHSTPFNQGLASHLAGQPYSASTIEGFAPLHDYGATDPAYGTASAAYDATSAAYGTGADLGDLAEAIWPPTDPVSTLTGYNHGAANIIPGVYPPVPNPTDYNYGAANIIPGVYPPVPDPTGYNHGAANIIPGVYPPSPNPALAPGTITTTQGGYESAVTNTNGSRPQCPTCNTTFKRASDLARHEKKHQPDRPFKCLVPGCSFKGAYRKDKLDAHAKSCHRRGGA